MQRNNSKILVNKAKCRTCGAVVESKHVYDFVPCFCFHDGKGTGVAVDGGKEYIKRCGEVGGWEELSEVEYVGD